MTPIIALRGVSKSYGGIPVLDALDLTVGKGEIFALLGPNGAGKTTLINILSTLVVPDSGTATIAGSDVVKEPDKVKRAISLTGQSASVDELLTGEENLRMLGRLSGLSPARSAHRATELLEQFGLTDHAKKRARIYSGGQRRRLDLALGLILTPPVVFLDEPTTGLDTRSRQELWEVIRSLADNGTTVLLTTQYLEEADQLADRIAVLDHGRIVAEGSPADLKARVGGEMIALHDASGAVVREMATDGTIRALRAALESLTDTTAVSVSLRSPSLDDVFLAVTGSPTSTELVLEGQQS